MKYIQNIYNLFFICIINISNITYDFLIYTKYFIYFVLFINVFTINILNYIITKDINNNLIKLLIYNINLNGCVLIKFTQWIFSNYKLAYTENNTIFYIFYKFYENCHVHDLNYTKKIFKKDFGYDFHDIIELDTNFNIKSASIAQVYKCKFKKSLNNCDFNQDIALKIIHPEIEYQLLFPLIFIKTILYIIQTIPFLNKYDLPFDTYNFLNGLINQVDMNNEYKNMLYFYNNHLNNNKIIIPKPIVSSKNILIMSYISGDNISKIDISFYNKQKLITYFALFMKYNYYVSDLIHCDLHDSNWKITKINDCYKIVIYDFGYVIENNNNIKYYLKNIISNIDFNNKYEVAKIHYENLKKPCKFPDFDSYYKSYSLITNNLSYFGDDLIIEVYKFAIKNNLKIIHPNCFEIFISVMLIREYLQKYLFNDKIKIKYYKSDGKVEYINFIFTVALTYYLTCKENNIYPELLDIIKIHYFDNPEMSHLYKYNSNYLENINIDVDNSIDI